MLEKAFKKIMADEEKGSGINPPEITDIERGIQEILEKSREVPNKDTYSVGNSKAEEMRLFLKLGIELKMKWVHQN